MKNEIGYNYQRKIFVLLTLNEYYPHEITGLGELITNKKKLWAYLEKLGGVVYKDVKNSEQIQIASYNVLCKQMAVGSIMNVTVRTHKQEKKFKIEIRHID